MAYAVLKSSAEMSAIGPPQLRVITVTLYSTAAIPLIAFLARLFRFGPQVSH
jgi:hypothetical protein